MTAERPRPRASSAAHRRRLAAGVLIDALIVRSLLVPATVSWLGRWSWWMPEHGRRLLRLPAVIPAAESMNTSSARAPGDTH